MLEVTAWFEEGWSEEISNGSTQSSNQRGRGLWSLPDGLVLVTEDYKPHDESIEILSSEGHPGYTLDSYIVKQYPTKR